jgi:hypothetical protein
MPIQRACTDWDALFLRHLVQRYLCSLSSVLIWHDRSYILFEPPVDLGRSPLCERALIAALFVVHVD